MATFLLLAFPMNQYFIVFGNFIFPLKSTWTSHHDLGNTLGRKRKVYKRVIINHVCVHVCLPVCAGAHVCIYEWKTEGKLSCCSRSTLAFVRQGLSHAWGLPNRLGWTANESQVLLCASQMHGTMPVFVLPIFLGWNSNL